MSATRTVPASPVVDVWEDEEESFNAFGQVIGPTLAQVGLNGAPEIHRLIGTISQGGARTRS